MGEKNKRGPGRPPRQNGPLFPVDEVDRLLVHGEPGEPEDGGMECIRYPTCRELADRYGVSRQAISNFSQKHNCLARRRVAKERARKLSDEKMAHKRADVLAYQRDEQITLIDRYLERFEESLDEDRVRADNVSDFNTMCRLRAYLMGDAESRHEVHSGMPTLEELQRRHKELLGVRGVRASVAGAGGGSNCGDEDLKN